MRWLQISVRVPPELVEPVVELFHRYGKQRAVIEEPGGFSPDEGETPPENDAVTVSTYLPENRGTLSRRARIEGGLRLLSLLRPLEVLPPQSITPQEWEEAWKAHFQVMRIGKRFVIRPPWQEYAPKHGELVLTLDPGMAFGTGQHPTTRMCLDLMESLVQPGVRVLDFGAGSGILSLGAAALGAGRVLGLEADSLAARVGRGNLKANDVGKHVRIVRGTLPHKEAVGIQVAMANISAAVLVKHAMDLFRCLVPGGVLVASGVLDERESEVTDHFTSVGFQVSEVRRTEDWLALRFDRPG